MGARAEWSMPPEIIARIGGAWGRVEKAIGKAKDAAAIFLLGKLKTDYLSGQVINRQSGNLSRSAFWISTGPFSARVAIGREAPYAYGLNYGNPPHVIEARPGGALRFEMGGEVIFARRVNHPGNPAFLFMEKALEENKAAMLDMIVKGAVEALGAPA